jgi:hypothetical protein
MKIMKLKPLTSRLEIWMKIRRPTIGEVVFKNKKKYSRKGRGKVELD